MSNPVLGNLIIVAAPSGGGKTSLVDYLVSHVENIEVSVSHTTRKKRPNEQEGVDYFFIEKPRFLAMIADNAFVEHAQVFGHYYGTSVAQISERLAAGIDVVLDIDWQGAQQIRRLFSNSISVFLLPPSLEILEQRLHARGQDDPVTITKRMQQAKAELSHYVEFDYLIVNDRFDVAARELQSVVLVNRLRTERQRVQCAKLLSFLHISE